MCDKRSFGRTVAGSALSLHLRLPAFPSASKYHAARRAFVFATSPPGFIVGSRNSVGLPAPLICIWHHEHSGRQPVRASDPWGLCPHNTAVPDRPQLCARARLDAGAERPRSTSTCGRQPGLLQKSAGIFLGLRVWGPLCLPRFLSLHWLGCISPSVPEKAFGSCSQVQPIVNILYPKKKIPEK